MSRKPNPAEEAFLNESANKVKRAASTVWGLFTGTAPTQKKIIQEACSDIDEQIETRKRERRLLNEPGTITVEADSVTVDDDDTLPGGRLP
jgi:hypothetical protein